MQWTLVKDDDAKIIKLAECKAGPLTINKYRRRGGDEFFACTASASATAKTYEEGGRLAVAELLRKCQAAAEAVGLLDTEDEAMRQVSEDRDSLANRVVELEAFVEGLTCHQQSSNSMLRRIGEAAEDLL